MMLMLTTMTITYILMLASMAFLTLLEQKILGLMQLRMGPNKNGWGGVLQPMADGLKLFTKEPSFIANTNQTLFLVAPLLNMSLAIFMWTLYPSSNQLSHLNLGLLLFLVLSSLMVYAVMMAGWASNAKYSLIGSLRSIAQTISYEISMALTMICSLMILNTFNTNQMWALNLSSTMIMLPPLFMIWFTTSLAETNRAPFDLAEGESELVSGFNTEYGSLEFALIFMSEYMNIIFMSLLTSILFLPKMKNMSILTIEVVMISMLYIVIRASYPRLRYDRLMMLTWLSYLPSVLSIMMLLISM